MTIGSPGAGFVERSISGAASVVMDMWEASDESLLAGFAAGDEVAAVAFVRRFQARVYGLAVAITRDRSDADEVAQEAFVRAWRYADSFDPRRGSVETWMLAITRTQSIDRVRISGRHSERRASGDDLDSVPSDDPDMDTAALVLVDVGRVTDAMRSLSLAQRQAVTQATLLGMSAGQISRREGLPLGTVKSRIRLRLRKLRAALEVELR